MVSRTAAPGCGHCWCTGGLERRFEIELGPAGRVARLDGKLIRSTAAALGAVSVVLFVPEDLLLPRAAPAARRRFLDLAIFNVERGYYAEASAFQKVLRNRNALLKRRDWDRTLLDTFDDELARTGARVVGPPPGACRRAGARALPSTFTALHGDLPVSLSYRSDPTVEAAGDEEGVRSALAEGLAERRSLDERRRFTGFGPQADDLEIGLSGALARTHASQGQLRSLMLALKLAELTEVSARLSDPPILLLDDVPSELDPSRRGVALRGHHQARLPDAPSRSRSVRSSPLGTDRLDFQVRAGSVAPFPDGGFTLLSANQMLDTWKRSGL